MLDAISQFTGIPKEAMISYAAPMFALIFFGAIFRILLRLIIVGGIAYVIFMFINE